MSRRSLEAEEAPPEIQLWFHILLSLPRPRQQQHCNHINDTIFKIRIYIIRHTFSLETVGLFQGFSNVVDLYSLLHLCISNLSIRQISNYLSGWYLCRHISSISTGHWTERQFSAYFSSVSRGRGGRIGKQNMRSKSSCSPGDAPSIHLPVHHLCAHHLLLKQDLAVSRRPSRGRISKQNKRSKKSSWGCFCLRLNIRNPKTPENLTKHEFEIITRSWSKNRKTFERLRCSSATNLTIKPEIYDLQKELVSRVKLFHRHIKGVSLLLTPPSNIVTVIRRFSIACALKWQFFSFRDLKKIKFWRISAPSKINWIFLDPRCLGDYDAALSELRIMIFFVLSGVWQIMTPRYSGTIYHPFFPIGAPRKLLSPSKGKHSVSRKRFKERTNQNCWKQERLHLQLQCINI